MRLVIALLGFFLVIGGSISPVPTYAVAGHGAFLVAAAQGQSAPSGKLDVDIDVNRGGGGVWYANPVWIGIGIVALILVVAIIAMAARGGGTTIIKE